jgi:hypothetical protein
LLLQNPRSQRDINQGFAPESINEPIRFDTPDRDWYLVTSNLVKEMSSCILKQRKTTKKFKCGEISTIDRA